MEKNVTENAAGRPELLTSRFIDWFAVGQGAEVRVDGITVSLRVVGQKGRRTRLVVIAPRGATFEAFGSR